LQTRADDFYASRSPIQAGAELYGFKGIEADIEVIEMMISSLSILDIENLTLSLGNTSIFSALTQAAELDVEITATLRDIFKRKSIPDLAVFLEQNTIVEGERFKALMSLEGGADVLDSAKQLFADLPQALEAIDSLTKLNEAFADRDVDLMFDLGEVKAYEYHNGVVFAAYHTDFSKALAQGGRYNGLSQSFGVARDATGFSLDLKFLIQQQSDSKFSPKTLLAPNTNDASLKAFVKELRSNGVVVKQDIENSNNANIVKSGNGWVIKD
jgi:ATP phosphoribosyltransferase regulatory subunit